MLLRRRRQLAQQPQQLLHRGMQRAGIAAARLPGGRADCRQQQAVQRRQVGTAGVSSRWPMRPLLRSAAGDWRAARLQGLSRTQRQTGLGCLPVVGAESQLPDHPRQLLMPSTALLLRSRALAVGGRRGRRHRRGRRKALLQHP